MMDILLGHINGIEPGSLKGMAPYQLWEKEEGEQEHLLFRQKFKDSGELMHLQAGREAVHMLSLFAALLKETRESYKSRVAEDKVKVPEDRNHVRELMEKPLAPLEVQKCVSNNPDQTQSHCLYAVLLITLVHLWHHFWNRWQSCPG